jgi:hypothetical protein
MNVKEKFETLKKILSEMKDIKWINEHIATQLYSTTELDILEKDYKMITQTRLRKICNLCDSLGLNYYVHLIDQPPMIAIHVYAVRS